jgi:predicted peptidase
MNRHTTLSMAVILSLTVLFGSLSLPAIGDVETGFINGQVTANGKTMLYVVYVPRNFAPEKKWPVILYLHGANADGKDGFRQVFLYGIGVTLWQQPQQFPCLVVMPQHPNRPGWSGTWNDLALQALEEVVKKYGGDRNRLYLTGVSLGGQATWQMASDHPALFAAAMPVAGWVGDRSFTPKAATAAQAKVAQALKSLPLWVFHGGADTTAPPGFDRQLVALIQAAGNPNIRYTEYPGLGHDVSDITYGSPKVIAWLLAQHR